MTQKLTKQHIALLFSLYITQFVGFAFITESLIAILRQNGTSLENLGFIYMLGLFFVFRFLWAPFVDKIKFKRLGHYRGWIIIFQTFMVFVLIAVSFFDILTNFKIIIALSVLFAFFAASQDIALDALVFKTVHKDQRSVGGALKTAGGLVGGILGGGVALIIYSYVGWEQTIQILAFTTSISLIQLYFYKEPSSQNEEIEDKINFKQYIDFWKPSGRKKWLLLLFLYPITISSAYGLLNPMLVDAGWTLDKIGFAVHIVGYGIGLIASFSTSWVINKFGKKIVLVISALGQSIGMLLLLFIINGYSDNLSVMLIVGFIFMFYMPSAVVMITIIMDQVSSKSPASQFAIQHSVYMFSGVLFAGFAISLSGVFGYSSVIIVCSIIGLFAVYLSTTIDDSIIQGES
ncbi:MFS transporter [Sulfurimonas sp.]|uniref:MFS transporter n=1 Tax=Sulfurimonas sp. TaxID=2022749 RepID=UPI002B47301C|nr:MFS transporter [Sulfurimonas sp.]